MKPQRLTLLFLLVALLPGFLPASSSARSLAWPSFQDWTHTPLVPTKAIQLLLNARGYRVAVDGNMGPQTKRAIRRFQSAKRLPASGVMTDSTWERLVVPVKRGSKGPAVRAVQMLLNLLGSSTAVDGNFAAQTERAVRKFQKGHGLKADGLVARHTWHRLMVEGGLYYE